MTTFPSGMIPVANFRDAEFVKIGPFPHPTQISVMPVVAYRGDELRPLGTCFAISNHGLVMTARHVLDEALQLNRWDASSPPSNTSGWWVGALYIAEPEPGDNVPDLVGGLLQANHIYLNPNSDIAVMHLNLPVRIDSNAPINVPALKLGPAVPQSNAVCLAVGYHAMRCDITIDSQQIHNVTQCYSGTRGRIQQIHFPNRDAAFLNFPCFQTTSRFDPGMSGGPIFNEAGSVVGVVCSSFGHAVDGHISYGSLIGPALFLQIDTPNGRAFLYDFVSGGAVICDETLSHVKVMRSDRILSIDFGRSPVFQGKLRTA